MRKLILLPFLLFAACTSEAEPVSQDSTESQASDAGGNSPLVNPNAGAGANSTTDNSSQPARQVSDEELSEVMSDNRLTSSGNQLFGAPAKPVEQEPAYTPKRTPTYGFQVGGDINDTQLAEYYVDLTIAIDGEEKGVISLEMWPQYAPGTVRNFLRYCDEGFYDGLTFHRIMRDFMIQGGDPDGTGAGDGPHGNIIGEMQKPGEDARKHTYGVVSMAHSGSPNSGSCQFFIVCNEAPNVWNLDGSYASFGKMTRGVDVLEAAASVPVGGPRNSSPMVKVTIVKAEVKKGEAPKSEQPIERPLPDLNGEPESIAVQHVLISFEGAARNVAKTERTAEEAKALAEEILAKAKAGEDFTALVKAHSDDNFDPEDANPSVYEMLNFGRRNLPREKAEFLLMKQAQMLQDQLRAQLNSGALSLEDAQKQFGEWRDERMAELDASYGPRQFGRAEMAGAFGDVGFKLEVGEVGMATPDAKTSPFGYHIIKRVK